MQSMVIADDHEIVREGVKLLLGQYPNLAIVAEATNGLEAISAVKRHKPDLLMLDVSMPYANALEVLIEVHRWSPATKVVVFTGVTSTAMLAELIKSGVDGLIHKSHGSREVCKAVEKVLAGQRFIQSEILTLIEETTVENPLTSREKQVLQLIVTGNTNAQIAELLSISPKTVDKHRSSLMKKLNVHSVAELMAYAAREGLLAIDKP